MGWLLRGGTIYDGTGAPGEVGDLSLEGARVAERRGDGARELDVRGMAVAPGFIDMHSHGDEGYLRVPDADSKVRQGVTLDVCGNCGFSVGPLAGEELAQRRDGLATGGIDVDWTDLSGFRRRLEDQGVAINVSFLVGHGTLRASVVGYADRPATRDERAEMARLLDAELDHGAIGISTGLIYTPGMYARTEEIVELCRVVADADGIYASHIRGEGDTLLEAVSEALSVGRQAELRVEVSHIKASGARNWAKMAPALELIEEARRGGQDVFVDQYPYSASATSLATILPTWARAGGRGGMVARLRDSDGRRRVIDELASGGHDADSWDQVMVGSVPGQELRALQGRTIADVAAERGVAPARAVVDVLVDTDGLAGVIYFTQSEDNVRMGMARADISVGSDSGVYSPQGPSSTAHPHPRAYGTFPRVLAQYARDENVVDLATAIHKMTGRAAETLRLADRGVLRAGAWGDVVVFDPDRIADRSTFADPHRFPDGILHVFVNGAAVILDGEPTGERPGQVVTR